MCDKAVEAIETYRAGNTPEATIYSAAISVDASNVDEYLK